MDGWKDNKCHVKWKKGDADAYYNWACKRSINPFFAFYHTANGCQTYNYFLLVHDYPLHAWDKMDLFSKNVTPTLKRYFLFIHVIKLWEIVKWILDSILNPRLESEQWIKLKVTRKRSFAKLFSYIFCWIVDNTKY